MTLEQYLAQNEPKKFPKVLLKKDEYIVGTKIEFTMGDSITRIFIEAFPEYEYAQINNIKNLYTTDSDGNPKDRSVFWIE